MEIRPATGSVIVEREEGTIDAEEVQKVLARIVSEERDENGLPLGASRHVMPGATRVARTVAHAFAEINNDVRRGLDQRADLDTLLCSVGPLPSVGG